MPTKPDPYQVDNAYSGAVNRTAQALEKISWQVDYLIDEQASNQAALLTAIASVVTAVEALAPL